MTFGTLSDDHPRLSSDIYNLQFEEFEEALV